MKIIKVFTLLVVFLFVHFSLVGQIDQATVKNKAEKKIRNFYEQLNLFADKSSEPEDRIKFKNEILQNFISKDHTLLQNDLFSSGSNFFNSEEYLGALKSGFPFKDDNATFRAEDIYSGSLSFGKGGLVTKVFYTLHFKGKSNNNSNVNNTREMKAVVFFPNNDLKRGYISKTEYATDQELDKEAELLKKNIAMIKEWESIRDSNDSEKYRSFLNKYPEGDFSTLAKKNMAELIKKIDHWLKKKIGLQYKK